MPTSKNGTSGKLREPDVAISAISVRGFKSLAELCRAEIRPLTILAGANSSGKSSIIQPLLLLKQTLEETYDPGPLLLNGPNVRFTESSQLLSRGAKSTANGFSVRIEFESEAWLELKFQKSGDGPLELVETNTAEHLNDLPHKLVPGMSGAEILQQFPGLKDVTGVFARASDHPGAHEQASFSISRDRCFLNVSPSVNEELPSRTVSMPFQIGSATRLTNIALRRLIHVPGFRGSPARTSKMTAVGATFPGTFETYAASVVHSWEKHKDARVNDLGQSLSSLGLTWKVKATPVNESEIKVEVGRLPQPRQGGARDLVSIADVGFGVSQVLPVLVALLVADPGQFVYIEQPEIHLHPRAQVRLGPLLVEAANRGVRVVIETHSDLLLRGIQTAVAKGEISSSNVALHWFQRSAKDGATTIKTAAINDAGAYGDWPEDFGDVFLDAEGAYLDAAQARHLVQSPIQ